MCTNGLEDEKDFLSYCFLSKADSNDRKLGRILKLGTGLLSINNAVLIYLLDILNLKICIASHHSI